MQRPILFTPGPLMTTDSVKEVMLVDYASRDRRFMEAVKFIREKMLSIAGLDPKEWTCILQQGAGTMAIEAAISTTFPQTKGKYLLLNTGKYAERQGMIVKRLGFPMVSLSADEGKELDLSALQALLATNPDIASVGFVHHETSTGMIYPAESIASIVRQNIPKAILIMDAMSSFGGIPLNVDKSCDVLITSANKCFHGVPGFAIILARRSLIQKCNLQARSSTLDLYAQLASFEKSGQFIITPPVHTIMAFRQALQEYEEDGGLSARMASYALKSDIVVRESRKLGFTLFLDDSKPSFGHIVVCLNMPRDPKWNFKNFFLFLNERGFIIYPGKASHADTFRIGIIGSTSPQQVKKLMLCAKEALLSMGIEKLQMNGQVSCSMPVNPVGSHVAFFTVEHQWVLGKVTAFDSKSQTYSCSSTDPVLVSLDSVPNDAKYLWFPPSDTLNEDVDDLLNLTELHEASLLFCLKTRYLRDVAYTNIGPIIVALNPFSFSIPWYTDAKMNDYLNEGQIIETNLPHPWALAHNTYWEMRESGGNQTILVSGESGAGKTEAVKMVLRYLGSLSTKNGTLEDRDGFAEVNKRVLAASPILESFGNAKTVRNDNSSRFGKFSRVQFDANGLLVGCHVTKYLLEKSRIITAAKNERVFHSYYQLAQGPRAKEFFLRNPKVYRVLNAGECITIDGVNDALEYMTTKQAMDDAGITEEEQTCIWRVVAGILFLQNVDFVESEERSGRVAKVDVNLLPVLGRVCELWGVNENEFKNELVATLFATQKEQTVKPLNKVQALDTRDSVCKCLYDWLFDWLVLKINVTTNNELKANNWIGLLDIFGFENFQKNSFEQLCINLANEVLQGHYNQHIFTMDMRECAEEGIDTAHVSFSDNKECVDLLMGKVGIFTLLDEECAVSGTEKNYIQKLIEKFGPTKQKGGNAYFLQCTGRAVDNSFIIRHYAADVQYGVNDFLNKNRDTLKDSMKQIFVRSKVKLIPLIIPKDSSKPSTKVTIGGRFIKQLSDLMSVINHTNPHWIRCIKPDASRQPRRFSNVLVMHQLRSAGVLDTVKVRKAGYPIRFQFTEFLRRYNVLRSANFSGREACQKILHQLGLVSKQAQLGKTKVFMNHEAFGVLNHAKEHAILAHVYVIQLIGRGCLDRGKLFHYYVLLHRNKILEERRIREEELRQQRETEERQRTLEAVERECRERMVRERQQHAAVRIQKHFRGFFTRKRFAILYLAILCAREEHLRDDDSQKYRNYETSNIRRVRAVEHRLKDRGENQSSYTSSQRRKFLKERREHTMRLIEEKRILHETHLEEEVAHTRKQRAISLSKNKCHTQKLQAASTQKKRQQRSLEQDAREQGFVCEMLATLQSHTEEKQCENFSSNEGRATVNFSITEQRNRTCAERPLEDTVFTHVRSQMEEKEWWKDERERRLASHLVSSSLPFSKHHRHLEAAYRVDVVSRVLQRIETEKAAAVFKKSKGHN